MAREVFHLRAQKLKHNLDQDVVFSLPEVQWCDHWSGSGYSVLLLQRLLIIGGKVRFVRGV